MQYVGVSTKMYLGYQASLVWMTRVRQIVDAWEADAPEANNRDAPGTGVSVRPFVIPSFPVLESALRIFAGSSVWVGAQNCSWGDGALTGEVSPAMLSEMGVRLVIIGHAERRELFGEDDDVIRRKLAAALGAGLTPVLCVGENTRSRPEAAAEHCFSQLDGALDGKLSEAGRLILAYEPVWAIGASKPAAPHYVNDVLRAIRRQIESSSGNTAAAIPIVYGGSAGPGSLPALSAANGLFLGRFAHDPENFGIVLDEATRPIRH